VGEMEDQMNQNWGMFSNRASKQQSGSALIEVIAALVILALVSLPLIKLFTYDSIFVSYAKHDLRSVNRAQEVMEDEE
jgi:Tfp pilus assembly protein PilV